MIRLIYPKDRITEKKPTFRFEVLKDFNVPVNFSIFLEGENGIYSVFLIRVNAPIPKNSIFQHQITYDLPDGNYSWYVIGISDTGEVIRSETTTFSVSSVGTQKESKLDVTNLIKIGAIFLILYLIFKRK
ncbi:MAG: hypothetical protein QXO40_00205 [Candidatus Aenigmatarchaeota archaeon]